MNYGYATSSGVVAYAPANVRADFIRRVYGLFFLSILVTVAANGRKALEASSRDMFDLILMDVQMPDMDGFATTAAIRTRESASGQRVPIIAMTAHAMKGDRERCLSAGMDGYVSKPIRAQELFSAIQEVLVKSYT